MSRRARPDGDLDFAALRLEEERRRLHHPLAFRSEQSRGRRIPEPGDGIRTCFERDAHRILHSKPFRRMRNKTQVFFSPENDHIATRMDHSLYVATISRTICRSLGLNDDLAFAIALGHDLGHAPFGHSGEAVLDRLLRRALGGGERFLHEAQSVRVVDFLSRQPGHDFVGLNLSYEVRDGIRCHNGESRERWVAPRPAGDDADPAGFPDRSRAPITLEGCVVRIADRIAYLGRDYEDALVALGDVPPLPAVVRERLGEDNRSIIGSLVRDVIRENRRHPERVGFSEEAHEAVLALRDFNYEHIYGHPRLEAYREKIDGILERIYEVLVDELSRRDPEDWGRAAEDAPWHLRHLARFVSGAGYSEPPPAPRVVVDFIALMTDGFAFRTFQHIALPEPVV